MIHPSIGRVVWFQPACFAGQPLRGQPFAALIAYVHGNRMVNLGGFDQNGQPFSATWVALMQDDDKPPETGYFAQWMPCQVGQAKKDEALSAADERKAAPAPSQYPYPAFPPADRT